MDIEEFNLIISEYKEKYGKKLEELKRIYNNNIKKVNTLIFKSLCSEYRKILKEMIIKLSEKFFKNYKNNIVVAFSGSLARNTNTLFSDIDLNFLTDSETYEDIIKIEDKIAYILQTVVGFRGRDKIHTMTVYLPLISNNNYEFIKENNYPIEFNDSKLYFYCRENAEKLMYENYNSTRNIYDVIAYFNQNDITQKLYEWTNCFEIIYDNKDLDIYKKNRIICKDKKDLILHIDSLINEINNDYKNIIINSSASNSIIKKIYKSNVLFNVYKMFAIYYRYEKGIMYFNVDEIENKSKYISKNFFKLFYEYLITIQILQVLFNNINKDLSSHSDEIIEFKSINYYYKKLTNKANIIKDLTNKKQKLYTLCIEEIKKLRNDLL